MHQSEYFKNRIFKIGSHGEFIELSLELFRYQAHHNQVYGNYLHALGVNPEDVESLQDIPFLPISFFKNFKVRSTTGKVTEIFTSSGTTGSVPSKHFITDLDIYEQSFKQGFRHFYGDQSEYTVLALLPSYLERKGSSLIYMAENFIESSHDPDSGFYLDELTKLHDVLLEKIDEQRKVLLLGVTFALLDFAEQFSLPENDTVVMETGGMKGRRREMLRAEVHERLKASFGVKHIHSEYGMTELLSQAYSKGEGHFACPPWMHAMIRKIDDPFSYVRPGKTGGMNIIDLANIESCAFIETQDLGRKKDEQEFEVMGRFDNADIRGCNLMVI